MKLLLLTILLTTSCLGFSSSSVEDLQGLDKNKNGVRDDVEEWIEKNVDNKLMRLAYLEWSKYVRKSFKYIDNKKKSIANTYQKGGSIQCIGLLYFDIYNKSYLKGAQEYSRKRKILKNENKRNHSKIKRKKISKEEKKELVKFERKRFAKEMQKIRAEHGEDNKNYSNTKLRDKWNEELRSLHYDTNARFKARRKIDS